MDALGDADASYAPDGAEDGLSHGDVRRALERAADVIRRAQDARSKAVETRLRIRDRRERAPAPLRNAEQD
jgi:hypothetical protein